MGSFYWNFQIRNGAMDGKRQGRIQPEIGLGTDMVKTTK